MMIPDNYVSNKYKLVFSKKLLMDSQTDPLMNKLRTTLFEIKKKGFGKIKAAPVQGSLLGVTLMTNRYKSKRRL